LPKYADTKEDERHLDETVAGQLQRLSFLKQRNSQLEKK